MAERYTRVFTAKNNLYIEGSPVILSAGALLKDNKTGNVFAQLKIKNISNKKIKALRLNISAFDCFGENLGGDISFEYLDLSAVRDEEFGQKTLIPLKSTSARSFEVTVNKVLFKDNYVWENDQKYTSALPELTSLALVLQDVELVKQYAMHFNQKTAKPEKVLDLWYCACGAINHQEEVACPKCGNKLESLLACDFEALKSERDERLAKEEAEREAAEEAERISHEKAAKKTKRVLSIVIPAICAVIAIVLAITKVIIPNNKYNAAVALINEGNIIEAYESLIALDGYKDSAEIAASIYDRYTILVVTEGEYITFGSYEQDNNTANGKEDIEWLVLERDGDKVLVISKYALDCKPYNTEWEDVTWETCTLRTWLNETFLNEAFSEAEQSIIQTTEVSADKNPDYLSNPGNATKDNVFLLSINEANEYFASDEARMCVPTAYAIANGAYTNDNYKVDGSATCWWWLRSPGIIPGSAAYVNYDGVVLSYGDFIDFDYFCVRPAMWIYLDGVLDGETETDNNPDSPINYTQSNYVAADVGDIIEFGAYEQDNDTSNGKEPIEWQVLERDGDKVLVISKYALDCKPYNTEYEDVTWETCTLRTWLNETFLNEAFSEAEQIIIQTTEVSADRNPDWSTDPGNATEDKIFLLSIIETYTYFASDEASMCVPTAYAIANGAWTSGSYNVDGEATCWWWLRSPGLYQYGAALVYRDGGVDSIGHYVFIDSDGVRPAMWIYLDA